MEITTIAPMRKNKTVIFAQRKTGQYFSDEIQSPILRSIPPTLPYPLKI
jgi:hypothetical protein